MLSFSLFAVTMAAEMVHPDVTAQSLAADLGKIADQELRVRLACHFCSLLLTGRFTKEDHLEFAEIQSAEAAAAIAVGTPYKDAMNNMLTITRVNLMRSKTWNDQVVLINGLKAHEETLTALDKANTSRIYKKKHPDDTD